MAAPQSLIEHFAKLEDPRVDRNKKHELKQGREGVAYGQRMGERQWCGPWAQVKTAEKSNEMRAIPELLKRLELKGCIVTVDVMGCQTEIAQKVHEGGNVLMEQ